MSYQKIKLRPISGSLGSIIEGVDLSSPLDDETFGEIKQALLENLVIFFRDQKIRGQGNAAPGKLLARRPQLHLRSAPGRHIAGRAGTVTRR